MLTPRIATFLRNARSDSGLEQQVTSADSYTALELLSSVAADELRSAFTSRNAGVLVHQMVRKGILDHNPLTRVPQIDEPLWNRVAALDLSAVTRQLIDYAGWTAERAASIERRYRRFFYLKAAMPRNVASPTPEIDEFWHQHIINTERYGPDCMRVAGRFLHHSFLSHGDPAQSSELQQVWLATWICYEGLFEEPYEGTIGAAFLERWPRV